jgi:hypothetical protein
MADMAPAGHHISVDPANVSFEEDGAAAAKDAAGGRREVGDQDQVWSLSTAKPGNGVEQLRDGDLETYWQCVACPCRILPFRRTGSCHLSRAGRYAGRTGRSHTS